jgi:redox-sensitive bicupin YhaK (pirin superfamily)
MIDLTDSREAMVGGIRVRRALPTRGRRTVGAWCFADHMGPANVTETNGLDVAPHPHTGLHTVTWLIDGQALHHDSLGSEQVIKPGQLNLMTAGHGVAHSEEATGHYRGTLQGIQLWVAQPETTRHGASAFEHHSELPRAELDGAVATVLVGELGDASSPARHDTPLVGADLAIHAPATVPLRPDFEYAAVAIEGEVEIDGQSLVPGKFGYLGSGRDELLLDVPEAARVILLGGEPFESPVVMWWNFVARSHDEIDASYASWRDDDGRFGTVKSALPRLVVGPPPWPSRGSRA